MSVAGLTLNVECRDVDIVGVKNIHSLSKLSVWIDQGACRTHGSIDG